MPKTTEEYAVTVYSTIGLSFITFNRIQDAIDLGVELPGSDQSQYYENLTIHWYQQRPDELLENLEKLPTNEIRQSVARILLNDRMRFIQEMSAGEISALEQLLVEQP